MWTISDSMPWHFDFSYCISGRVQWSIDGVPRQFTTQKGQCEIISSSNTSGKGRYDSTEPLVMVDIMLCPKLLQNYFDVSLEGPCETQMLRLPRAEDEVLYRKRWISDAEQKVVRQLLRAPCRSAAERLFIQGKVMELVSFQVGALEAAGQERMEQSVPNDVQNLTSRAKAILQSRMQSPPTIQGLARMVGTNETKLKKCFRSHLGTTVFGYLTSCRMQRACELLDDSSLTMSQIGAELGYSERTHFTRAFSRYFSMSPSQYRRDHQRPPSSRRL
jgi:AraC-like DNA-binding protein